MRSTRVRLLIVIMLVTGAACHQGTALPSDVYVWNREWTTAVVRAVREKPSNIDVLRVLVRDGAGGVQPVLPRGQRIIPVWRTEVLPDEAEWRRFGEQVEKLERSGLRVEQVELDYDSPTSQLDAYVEWLESTRAGRWRRSVTALPSWVTSGLVGRLSTAVDEVVLQVHAVHAPVLFELRQASRDVTAWAEQSRRPFRVALPAYRARLASGSTVAAEPKEVAAMVRELREVRGVSGVVFFRLGNDDDRSAFSLETLRQVAGGERCEGDVGVELRALDDSGVDVWLSNETGVDARAPERFIVEGEVSEGFITTGYVMNGVTVRARQPMWLRPHERLRIGTVRGKGLHVTEQ